MSWITYDHLYMCVCMYVVDYSQLNPGAQGEHLTIQGSWLAAWLLVKHVCPVHLVQWWGFNCGSGNEETVRTKSYMKLATPLKRWFNTVELPNLFCLAGTEWACVNSEGDHGVTCRWRQLTLVEWQGFSMWERWSWSVRTDCWGWVRFSTNACV